MEASGVALIWIIPAAAALLTLAAILAGLLLPAPADPLTGQYFSAAFREQAAAYQQARLAVSLLRQLVSFGFTGAVVVAAMRYWQTAPPPSLAAAAGMILLFLLAAQLLDFPFAYYRGFVIEHRFGLSTATASAWLLDYGKSTVINLAITTGALAGLYWLVMRRPERWWIAAGTAAALFMLLGSYLYPVLIDPLFYRFTTLEDAALHSEIMELAAAAGINIDQVLVADAGRRTSKVNAYFTGMGRTRRIVLYDTLLQRFSREEVLAVVAHEMGHWRGRHLAAGVALGVLGVFAALFLLNFVTNRMGLAGDFRIIPLSFLFMLLITTAAAPLQNAISRAMERQADAASLELTGNPAAVISLQQNLAYANLSVVRPHPLLKYALYTHPPAMERIEHARDYLRP